MSSTIEYRTAESLMKAISREGRVRRSVPDFIGWMTRMMEAAGALHRLNREEGHKLRDFRDWKSYREELLPLYHWLKSMPDLSEGTYVQVGMQSVPPDASLTFSDGSILSVEVVKHRDGWREDWEFECLRRFGSTPLTYKGGTLGMKATLDEGKPPELEAVDSRETFARLSQNVQKGINLKAEKSKYEALRPIVLLAVADDTLSSDLKEFSAALSIPDCHPFEEIYLVSTNSPNSMRLLP